MGGGTQVTTQSTGPWKGQQKYLLKAFDMAEKQFNKVPEYYQGETVAGFDPAEKSAQQATLGYAMGPRAGAMQAGGEEALLRSLGGYTGFTPG